VCTLVFPIAMVLRALRLSLLILVFYVRLFLLWTKDSMRSYISNALYIRFQSEEIDR